MAEIRDLVYLDLERATSLFSQLEGGLLERIQAGTETVEDERNIRGYNLGVFKPEFGGQKEERRAHLEVRVLHHDLLRRLEELLINNDLAVSLGQSNTDQTADETKLRALVSEAPYIRATGWTVVEDYTRLSAIGARMNDLNAFIGRCTVSTLRQTAEYQELETRLIAAKTRVKAEKDKNRRARLEKQVTQHELLLREKISELTGLRGVEKWLIEGIRMFVDLFMKDRILLRLYPAPEAPRFQILSHLKRNCFVDGDLDTFIATYGNRPTVQLTVLGLITAVPPEGGPVFDPTSEYASPEGEKETFEAGFRRVFDAFEGFYDFVRYSRYPNITVSPIAVYRRIGGRDDE